MDFSADLEFVLVEQKRLQVALQRGQGLVEVAVRVLLGTAALHPRGSGLDGTFHDEGQGAHHALQAGDVSLDLAEVIGVRAPQFIVQKSEVVDDGI